MKMSESKIDLVALMGERIASGLKRKTITSCSQWAEAYRIMGQPFPGSWTTLHHPWLQQMLDDENEHIVGKKAAQMGFTEVALNKVFYKIDVYGVSCLYLLPASTPDASDFSSSRFDPALEASPHLQNLFSDVKNVGHKRAGTANLYIRGSRSRSQLKSIPVGQAIFDELDEMVQKNIPLALERMSGQLEKQIVQISTPTIDHYGIDEVYRRSTQALYNFKCPSCKRWTYLEWEKCFVVCGEHMHDPKVLDSYMKCRECDAKLPHEGKIDYLSIDNSQWIEGYTDRLIKGYHVSQMYSMTVKPHELALSFLKAETNPSDEQEFYNSKLGETHTVDGARVTDTNLIQCIGTYKKLPQAPQGRLITMGVDVGKWLHYEIDEWTFDSVNISDLNVMAKCRIIAEGKVLHFEELDKLMHQFRIRQCVIDANPERRKALEFAKRFYGYVRCCFYGNNVNGKQIHLHGDDEHTMTVDRTSWLDMSLGRFIRERISVPQDLSQEYKNHIKAPVRVYREDKDGNQVGKYVTGNEDDHYAHARNYSEIALPLAVSISSGQDITGVY